MALDGFSLRQVGLAQDNTSAQMAMNTEQSIRSSRGTKNVDQIANMDSEKAVTLDEEKEKDNSRTKTKLKKRVKKKKVKVNEKAESPYTIETESLDSKIKDLYFYKKFSDQLAILLNRNSEIIELYNKNTNTVVETINTTDLIKLIDKLKISSGVLVNKKI